VRTLKKPVSYQPTLYRYCLNYKGLPFKTVWLEYPDIEPTFRQLGIPPDLKIPFRKPDGSPMYTVPAIYDPKTKTSVVDSIDIAEYLDKTYPDNGRILVPPGTRALISSFTDFINSKFPPMFPFLIPKTAWMLNPKSEEYFRRTREEFIFGGRKLEEVFPTEPGAKEEQLKKVKESIEAIGEVLRKEQEQGGYVMGSTISFADFSLAGLVSWTRVVLGEESEEWRDISRWGEGVFGNVWERLKVYEG